MKVGRVEKSANVGAARRKGERERTDKLRGPGVVSLGLERLEEPCCLRDSK